MKQTKKVWYQCRDCGNKEAEKPEDLRCPGCGGTMERRSEKIRSGVVQDGRALGS